MGPFSCSRVQGFHWPQRGHRSRLGSQPPASQSSVWRRSGGVDVAAHLSLALLATAIRAFPSPWSSPCRLCSSHRRLPGTPCRTGQAQGGGSAVCHPYPAVMTRGKAVASPLCSRNLRVPHSAQRMRRRPQPCGIAQMQGNFSCHSCVALWCAVAGLSLCSGLGSLPTVAVPGEFLLMACGLWSVCVCV